jgi:hypothetical protein
LAIKPGVNQISIPLSEVQNAPNRRTMDMTRVRRLAFYADRPSGSFSIYFDAFQLICD